TSAKRRVTVTVTNEGHADLLLNMECSARLNGVPLDSLVVFAAQKALRDGLAARGIGAFYHDTFGEMPARSDRAFGSADFICLMWLKIVAVWLPLSMGFDVLFVDDDLVWWRSIEHLLATGDAAGADVVIQDDGSRRNDFSPTYGNTGKLLAVVLLAFGNPRTLYFMRELAFSYDMVYYRGTHQGVFDTLLDEHLSRTGLTSVTLPEADMPGG
ncbi:unnamed protein product, partial [Phaeothamnion confervicola]